MPRFNKITCSIELGPSNSALKEYGIRYSDGHVETFIAVPDTDLPFSIHLTTEGYIAPGVAFFVFIDGEYQCNRNRTALKLPGEGVQAHEYETEFRVRQKEEKTSTGTFVARDWTFAKLDRVAADKAPNLNPRFSSNVGTIEVIVLRCRAAFEDTPPPQAYQRKTENVTAKHKTELKRSLPPEKSASPPQSELGGLFGLFDGACDEPSLAVDRSRGFARSVHEHVDNFGTFDGAGDPPGVVINQWTGRGREEESWRTARKDTNGQWKPNAAAEQNVVPNQQAWAAPAGQPNQPLRDPSLARVVAALESMRNSIEDYLLDNERNAGAELEESRHDLDIIRQILADLQGPRGSPTFPEWITDAFEDIEAMRQHTSSLQKHFVKIDFTNTMQQLAQQQINTIRDARLRKQYETPDDLRRLALLFEERIALLERYLEHMDRPVAVSSDALRDRVKKIREQRARIIQIAQNLDQRQQFVQQRGVQHSGRGYGSQPPGQAAVQSWGDGHHRAGGRVNEQQGWNDADEQRNDKQGWQQVGVGSWEPGRRWSPKLKPADAGGWCGNAHQKQTDDQAPWWAGPVKEPNGKSGAKEKSKGTENNGWNQWDNGADQNNGQKSCHGGSKKTTEHDFGDNKSRSGHSNANGGAGWGNNNNGGDNNNNNWNEGGGSGNDNNAWDQQPQGNAGWDAPKTNSKANSSWSENSQKTGRSQRNRATESDAAKENAYIKPYWADWNKPFDRNLSAKSDVERTRVARQVYNYPVTPLPAIPEDKAQDRSYGVQVSRGADYSHKCRKPIYLDSMEAPYAVFSFKYRSRGTLENILKRKIDATDLEKILEQAERDRLANMPKHKLVEELMKKTAPRSRSRRRSGSQADGKSTRWKPDAVQGNGGDGWEQQGASESNHSGRASHHSSRKSNKTGADWDNNNLTNNAAGGWGDKDNDNAKDNANDQPRW